MSTLRGTQSVSFTSASDATNENAIPRNESVIGSRKPMLAMIHLLSMMMPVDAAQKSSPLTHAGMKSKIEHGISGQPRAYTSAYARPSFSGKGEWRDAPPR